MSPRGWIGVDLDGTLAFYHGWKGPQHIGAPIPRMVARVKSWLAQGFEVRIFTARVSGGDPENTRPLIEAYCLEHLGRALAVTNEKDYGMIRLFDDRAIQVIENTGDLVDGAIGGVL